VTSRFGTAASLQGSIPSSCEAGVSKDEGPEISIEASLFEMARLRASAP
jgi:hypothetical protein